jgi:hypothetical protein
LPLFFSVIVTVPVFGMVGSAGAIARTVFAGPLL